MLTPLQIEITDCLLKHLQESGGTSSLDDYPEHLSKAGFKEIDCQNTEKILIDELNLIDYVNETKYMIRLTIKGNEATIKGIKQYLEEIQSGKDLEKSEKVAIINNVKISRWNMAISGIAALISVVILVINLLDNKNNQAQKAQYQSNNGYDSGKSDQSGQTLDSLRFEEIKFALKHDTVFLNEIKKLIIRDSFD